MSEERKREIWVDNVKVVACVLVVLGHFFQSMTTASILPSTDLYRWFIQTIYYFHVPLFFLCSGYLYQKYSRVTNGKEWKNHVRKKALALGVPYFLFSTATVVLKNIFSGSVNTQAGGLAETLFLKPASPYWYLYCLFFIFAITVTFQNRKMVVLGLIFALALKGISFLGGRYIYAVSTVLANEIWLVLGMCLCVVDFPARMKTKRCGFSIGILTGIAFLVLSVLVYVSGLESKELSFLLGVLACFAVIVLIMAFFRDRKQSLVWGFLARYTMPIFLMHTIFAAAMRSLLLKAGIESALPHVAAGIGMSFIGPVVTAMIMERFAWLNFFLYPGRYVQIGKKK